MTLFRERPDLLERFRRGEREAFEAVYWAYVDRIERLVRNGFVLAKNGSHVNGTQRHDVGDLVQEIFAKAFTERARMGYDGLREYGPYLSTIARNSIIDWARRHGREIPTDSWPETLEPLQPAEPDPAWAQPALVAAVEGYLAELAPELRGVHEQRFVLGRSQYDAATALGLSRQQVRTLEKRLRDGLAKRLQRMGIEP